MGIVDRILDRRRHGPGRVRSWPVGKGELVAPDHAFGHDQSEFSPEEYGDYLATSNDIYSVAQARARLLADLRMQFFHGRGSDKIEDTTHPAVRLWWYVNPFWTAERLARMDELAMCVWGHTAWAVEGPRWNPKEIWWLKPSRLKPVPDATGYISGFRYHSMTGEILPFRPHEIVWQRFPNPIDEFSPLAPLAAARLAAATTAALMKSHGRLFSNGLQLAGVVVPATDKVTFSKDQANDLENMLTRRLAGADKAHKWAVLRYEAQFKELGISPKDAEFSVGLGLTFRQVCRAYGMQSALQNDLENATLANANAFERIEWTRSLKPDAGFRSAEIREQYLPLWRDAPDWCEHDFSTVPSLQESATETWTREAQALDRGAITINEWRKGKGMAPVPWGDRPYMPVNKAPLDPATGLLEIPSSSGGSDSLPDDEVNPAQQPPQSTGEKSMFMDHMQARKLLASFKINGVKV